MYVHLSVLDLHDAILVTAHVLGCSAPVQIIRNVDLMHELTCHIGNLVLWHFNSSVEYVQGSGDSFQAQHIIAVCRYVNLVQDFITGVLVLLSAMLLAEHFLFRCLQVMHTLCELVTFGPEPESSSLSGSHATLVGWQD